MREFVRSQWFAVPSFAAERYCVVGAEARALGHVHPDGTGGLALADVRAQEGVIRSARSDRVLSRSLVVDHNKSFGRGRGVLRLGRVSLVVAGAVSPREVAFEKSDAFWIKKAIKIKASSVLPFV